jgi:cysteine sulfinate desulfinase/cysteine desulfurase-like protein
MGYDDERGRGLLRLSLGRFNTEQEVNCFLEILPRVLTQLTKLTGAAVCVDQSVPDRRAVARA